MTHGTIGQSDSFHSPPFFRNPGGQQIMYDPITSPFGELIANGYLDCPCYLK